MDNKRQPTSRNFQTILSEMAAYGEYEPKSVKITLRTSEAEKEAMQGLADALNVSVSLLMRVLVKKAIQEYEQQGINPMGDFEVRG